MIDTVNKTWSFPHYAMTLYLKQFNFREFIQTLSYLKKTVKF